MGRAPGSAASWGASGTGVKPAGARYWLAENHRVSVLTEYPRLAEAGPWGRLFLL